MDWQESVHIALPSLAEAMFYGQPSEPPTRVQAVSCAEDFRDRVHN